MISGNRKVKSTISIMLIVSIFLPMIPIYGLEINSSDINTHWGKEVIQKAISNKFIDYYQDGTFKPNNKISKLEFIDLINKAFAYNIDADIIKNEQGITRQEVARIISDIKNLPLKPEETNHFKDKDSILESDKGYVGAVVSKGYMKGYNDSTFRPNEFITRAESVAIIDRILAIVIDEYPKDSLNENIDKKILNIIEKFGVAGISAAIVKEDKMIWSGNYGWHDIEQKKILMDDSVIRIASISKSITALAVMQLVDAGKLDLDKDINVYLSEKLDVLDTPIRNPKFPDVEITTRQLLNHTSSITNGKYVEFCNINGKESNIPTLDDYFNQEGEFFDEKNWANFEPGTEFEYSNMGYVLLGAIIESVSEKRFDKYVNENIIYPLGMKNSSFNVKDININQLTPMYRRISDRPEFSKKILKQNANLNGYVLGSHGGIYGPQGGLLSTAEDLSKFMIAMINEDETILSKELIKEMHTISVKTDKDGESTFWGIYTQKGLGIHITDSFVNELKMYGHTGGAYGIITDLYYTKDEKKDIGIVFLINGCNEEIYGERSGYYKIEEELADLLYEFGSETVQ